MADKIKRCEQWVFDREAGLRGQCKHKAADNDEFCIQHLKIRERRFGRLK